MTIREISYHDLESLLKLYTQLHENKMPVIDLSIENLWNKIMADENHHILIGIVDETIVCSCVLMIVPNLTHSQQPYAFIENVITHEQYRNRGYATSLLTFASDIAIKENCYKIMLMTGSKKDETLHFYEKAGFNRIDKTAFIRWI